MLVNRLVTALMSASTVILWSVCDVTVAQTPVNPLVEQMVAERAALLVSLSHRFETREREILVQIAARSREVSTALRETEVAAAERGRLQSEMSAIANDCTELTRRLGASFPDFAADLAVYRAAVTSLANSPDPRRVAALERYASGDRAGALIYLREIQEAETRAVAAGWREIGALALDMRDRGERSTGQVSEIFVQAHRLDPSNGGVTRQLVELLMEEHRYAEAESAVADHQRTELAGEARASALLLQGEIAFQVSETQRASVMAREAVTAYDVLRAASPNDLTLLLRWLEAVRLTRSTMSGAQTLANRDARNQERSELTARLLHELSLAPPFSEIEQPAAIFELVLANCGERNGRHVSLEVQAELRERCFAGAAALQNRFPNTYFAQRAQLVSAIARIPFGESGMYERAAVEMPAVLNLARQLIERDPDSVGLIANLGPWLTLQIMSELTRSQGPLPSNSPTLSSMRDIIALHESVLSRLTPREQFSLLGLYANAVGFGLSPETGPSYSQRGRALLDQINREQRLEPSMRTYLQYYESTFSLASNRMQLPPVRLERK